MPTLEQVPRIIHQVELSLKQAQVPIKITGHRLDDGWLSIVIEPTESNVRASEYADLMSEVERKLRREGVEEVVLVPALAE